MTLVTDEPFPILGGFYLLSSTTMTATRSIQLLPFTDFSAPPSSQYFCSKIYSQWRLTPQFCSFRENTETKPFKKKISFITFGVMSFEVVEHGNCLNRKFSKTD